MEAESRSARAHYRPAAVSERATDKLTPNEQRRRLPYVSEVHCCALHVLEPATIHPPSPSSAPHSYTCDSEPFPPEYTTPEGHTIRAIRSRCRNRCSFEEAVLNVDEEIPEEGKASAVTDEVTTANYEPRRSHVEWPAELGILDD